MSLSQTQTNIYNFLRQFAQPYLENQVPTNTPFQYLTYNFDIENWRTTGLGQIRLWDKSNNFSKLFEIADKIEDTIKEGYTIDNLILHSGTPFAQIMPQEDTNIKCLYINLEIDYL